VPRVLPPPIRVFLRHVPFRPACLVGRRVEISIYSMCGVLYTTVKELSARMRQRETCERIQILGLVRFWAQSFNGNTSCCIVWARSRPGGYI
jgi:hypothetical protein